MTSPPDQSSTPKMPAKPGQSGQAPRREERREAWRPRVVKEHPFNVFESDHQGPDSVPPPSKIQDPTQETTPLEGTRDRSEEDSMEPDYVASEPRMPDQRDRLGSADRHLKTTPDTQNDIRSDTRSDARPNDRTTLGR